MLRLPPGPLGDLLRHGEAAYPAEACGVLLGPPGGPVTAAVPCRNEASEPARRFRIGELELLRLAKAARARGEELVGFYHSHPDAPAAPSAADLADAWWPGCAWVIAAVRVGRAAEVAAFRLEARGEARRFVPLPLAPEGA